MFMKNLPAMGRNLGYLGLSRENKREDTMHTKHAIDFVRHNSFCMDKIMLILQKDAVDKCTQKNLQARQL